MFFWKESNYKLLFIWSLLQRRRSHNVGRYKWVNILEQMPIMLHGECKRIFSKRSHVQIKMFTPIVLTLTRVYQKGNFDESRNPWLVKTCLSLIASHVVMARPSRMAKKGLTNSYFRQKLPHWKWIMWFGTESNRGHTALCVTWSNIAKVANFT